MRLIISNLHILLLQGFMLANLLKVLTFKVNYSILLMHLYECNNKKMFSLPDGASNKLFWTTMFLALGWCE